LVLGIWVVILKIALLDGVLEYVDKLESKNMGNKLHRQRTINALGGMNLIEMLLSITYGNHIILLSYAMGVS
jgi:hypothetical protein